MPALGDSVDAAFAGVPGGKSAVLTAAALSAVWLCRETLFYGLEKAVSWAQGQPTRRARNAFLQGNFAPLKADQEETVTPVPLTVTAGALPDAVAGAFLRIGPNPDTGITGDYHWFDGNGWAHAVRLVPAEGKAFYASHAVRTSRRAAELKAGHPIFTKFGDYRGAWALAHLTLKALRRAARVLPPGGTGDGTANTALVVHARRLLALHEGDLPYALRVACDGALETLGRAVLSAKAAAGGGKGKGTGKGGDGNSPSPIPSLTAHPKIDPADGWMYGISYNLEARPYLTYVGVDPAGNLAFTTPVDTPDPVMMHDLAITERNAVFLDVPLVFKPEAMVGSAASMPFVFDKARGTRFGVTPKRGGGPVTWCTLEGPGVMIFHVSNAWDCELRGGKPGIKLLACVFDEFDLDLDGKLARKAKDGEEGAGGKGGSPDHYARLAEVTLDLEAGTASRLPLCPLPGDFPRIPASLIGRENRFSYVATMDPASAVPLFTGVAKVDHRRAGSPAKAVAGLIAHGPHRYGGECAFVDDPARKGEDAGYLLTYVHDESPAARAASPDGKGVSELVVYDAKTMAPTPVAVLRLPSRVPFGFHVHHMTEEEVKGQAGAPWGVEEVEEGAVTAAEE